MRPPTIRAPAAALLLAAAAPLPAAADGAGEAPGEGFDVTRYALALTPDIANRAVAGDETITLRATRNGVRALRFSANALTIERATLDGGDRHG